MSNWGLYKERSKTPRGKQKQGISMPEKGGSFVPVSFIGLSSLEGANGFLVPVVLLSVDPHYEGERE